MTFEVKQGNTSKQSAWTDSVRNAFRKQACQAKLREAYATAARNWADRVWYHHNQRWMRATGEGRAAARDGKFKDEVRSVLQHWNKRIDRPPARGAQTFSSEKGLAETKWDIG